VRFWKRHHEPDELEALLQGSRPEPREEFVRSLAERIAETAEPTGRRPGSFRLALAAGVTTLLITAAGIGGGIAYSKSGGQPSSKSQSSSKSSSSLSSSSSSSAIAQYEEKETICHIPPGNPSNAQTIRVGASAVPAHLAHGDTLGPCEDED
jgi:hypothetical protein